MTERCILVKNPIRIRSECPEHKIQRGGCYNFESEECRSGKFVGLLKMFSKDDSTLRVCMEAKCGKCRDYQSGVRVVKNI